MKIMRVHNHFTQELYISSELQRFSIATIEIDFKRIFYKTRRILN